MQVLGEPESFTTSCSHRGRARLGRAGRLTYPDTIARVSGSALMPHPYSSQGGYRATFTDGVLEHDFVAGFTGEVAGPVVHECMDDGHREVLAEGSEAYTPMIDHVLACLRGEEVNQLVPSSVLESLRLTLELHEAVNRR